MRKGNPRWNWTGSIPEVKPIYRGFDVDPQGRIWVALHTPSISRKGTTIRNLFNPIPNKSWGEPQLYDVIKPDGAYVGRVQVDWAGLGGPSTVCRGDTVWIASVNDDYVPVIRRFRIKWPD
jgi:hypothetical protein